MVVVPAVGLGVPIRRGDGAVPTEREVRYGDGSSDGLDCFVFFFAICVVVLFKKVLYESGNSLGKQFLICNLKFM